MTSDPFDTHGEAATVPVADNRRAFERCASTRPFPRRIYNVEDYAPLDAWILDVSCAGLALLVPKPLPLGSILFVELETVPEAAPVKVWATVVRCQPNETGEWLMGCELVNPLSKARLEDLLV